MFTKFKVLLILGAILASSMARADFTCVSEESGKVLYLINDSVSFSLGNKPAVAVLKDQDGFTQLSGEVSELSTRVGFFDHYKLSGADEQELKIQVSELPPQVFEPTFCGRGSCDLPVIPLKFYTHKTSLTLDDVNYAFNCTEKYY